MTAETEGGGGGEDRRRHERAVVATAIMVSPNGHESRTAVYDLSDSGARIGLPANFDFGVGAGVRLFFPLLRHPTIVLGAKIVRVAIDHLGIEFGTGQEAEIRQLREALAPD